MTNTNRYQNHAKTLKNVKTKCKHKIKHDREIMKMTKMATITNIAKMTKNKNCKKTHAKKHKNTKR